MPWKFQRRLGGRRKAEDEASRLAVDLVSLLLELEISKDEVSTIRAQALKEKKALDEAYEALT